MTEVPEHLLRRSRERREALGLATPSGDGGSTGGAAPVAAQSGEQAGGGTSPTPAAAPLPKVPSLPPSYTGPPQLPPRKNQIPFWAIPVLVVLPFWALFYFGALGDVAVSGPVDPVERGGEIYRSAGCAGCHGAQGQGGVGPQLSKGNAVKTFPNEADHEAWVTGGSFGGGKPYGDPAREGGQRLSNGGMPAFGSSLSPEDIKAVVAYEREGLDG